MDTNRDREASEAFSYALRAKWAESRRGLTVEDLMRTDRGKGDSADVVREDGGEAQGGG